MGSGGTMPKKEISGRPKRMKRISLLTASLAVFLTLAHHAQAQYPVPPPAATAPLRSNAELDQMLEPIALYPDPLIAQLLPAASLPSEAVMADSYLRGSGDANKMAPQPWDSSDKALA